MRAIEECIETFKEDYDLLCALNARETELRDQVKYLGETRFGGGGSANAAVKRVAGIVRAERFAVG